MSGTRDRHDSTPSGGERFHTTHWSVVISAGRSDSTRGQAALSELCRAYWFPLYAFLRRQGHPPHAAQDLTQEFFACLLRRNSFASADRATGRFRSFLLGALKHFLADERDRARALKRGGGRAELSLDDASAEERYSLEPATTQSAEKVFERRWALVLLDQVMARLGDEYRAAGKAVAFETLRESLTGSRQSLPYAQIAGTLGVSEGAVKVLVHRLRARYRELLRAEIARTVATPADVDEELRSLKAALRT